MKRLFVNNFNKIKEYRQEWKIRHNLIDIIFIAVAAMISNCNTWAEIGIFAESRKNWLEKHLELPNGVPSHDTIQRVFEHIDTKSFNQCFINWTREIADYSNHAVIAIDGKTSRGSFDHQMDKSPVHIVNAWIDSNKIILGQLKTSEKSNEITAIPELLDMLFVEGSIITIDAMGTQRDIATKIVDKKGDYILALKENQGNLCKEVKELFEEQITVNFRDIEKEHIKSKETINKGHGRIEKRQYYIINDIEWMQEKDKWKGLKSIGMVKNTTTKNDVKTEEIRYFITSLDGDVDLFAKGVRSHWGVESTHWILDVVFKEDGSRVRKNNGAANQSMLRKIVLNILKTETVSTKKLSNPAKRLKASLELEYLDAMLFK